MGFLLVLAIVCAIILGIALCVSLQLRQAAVTSEILA